MLFNTILLVGDGLSSKKVFGQNKSFLSVGKVPSFIRVLASLQKVLKVGNIKIVGSTQDVTFHLEQHRHFWFGSKHVSVAEQGVSLVDNIEIATKEFSCVMPLGSEDRVFIVPGDIPLVGESEIAEFLEKASLLHKDYVIGMTSKSVFLKGLQQCAFKEESGLLWFPFRENWYRINNFHLINPKATFNKSLIRKMYGLRHNRNFYSIFNVFLELCRLGSVLGFLYYGLVQLSMLFKLFGWSCTSDLIRLYIPIKNVEKIVSCLLGVRMSAVEISFWKGAIDIDSDADYFFMLENIEKLLKN